MKLLFRFFDAIGLMIDAGFNKIMLSTCGVCGGNKEIWDGREYVRCPECEGEGRL